MKPAPAAPDWQGSAELAPLAELAGLCGVELVYTDALGTERTAAVEAVLALLRALGEPVERGVSDAPAALVEHRRRRAARVVEPVAVAWDGEAAAVDLVLPASAAGAAAGSLEWRLEVDGREGRLWKRGLDRLATVGEHEVAGVSYVVKRLPLPGPLPFGYHRLHLTVGGAGTVAQAAGESRTVTVVSAPRRAYTGEPDPDEKAGGGRHWGVFLPLYALHGEESWGAGDLGDLRALAAWTAGQGGGLVGTLPILAAFLDEPFEPSPYAPASRLFWNELYVDPRRLPELARSPAARRILATADFAAEVAALRAERLVDYRRLAALKRPVLAALAETFFAAGDRKAKGAAEERRAGFEEFRACHPRLDDYAAFRAVGDRRREPWQLWPERLRGGTVEPGDYDEADFRYHLYAQWAAAEQVAAVAEAMAGAGPGLYLDLPLGVHPSSYDAWRERELFLAGVSTGAPPDLLFSRGQDWGFHPHHPERLREDGYRYYAAAYAHHLEHAGALRIDHVMQLHRLFCVPRGMAASEGLYLHYPAEELYAVLCLESHRARARIVGENLGTVPEYVDRALVDHGISGMFIYQFSVDADLGSGRARPPVPAGVAASLNSHDMPSFRGFLEGADIEDRRSLGLLTEEAAATERAERARLRRGLARRMEEAGRLHDPSPTGLVAAVLEDLAASAAALVVVSLEDLWGEPAPQNVPGTTGERPNWRRRARRSLAELTRDPDVLAALSRVDAARRRPPEVEPAAREDAAAPAGGSSQAPAAGPLSEDDLHLFNEGRHFRLHDKLGARPWRLDGTDGAWFAVWAPDAARVTVFGDFNGWDRGSHPLATRGSSGIWEGFVPGVTKGSRYKYWIESRHDGYRVEKADPFAVHAEEPPKTASVVWDLAYEWGDAGWMAGRGERAGHEAPVAAYEVHLGSWRRVVEEGNRPLTYREAAPVLADHVKELGFTHVEFLPLSEHPFYGSWGYQTVGYFAPTSRYGTPQDLMAMIDHLHQEGIGVILDWVPSHFPGDEHGLAYFDGTHLYEHADPRIGFHPDWDSYIFNYGRNEVRSFLISSALYWLEVFHADGLRVDAVASMLYRDYSRQPGEWIPNVHGGRENLEAIDFLRQLNEEIARSAPGACTFAEESTTWPGVSQATWLGGLGFGYKWDMGWMHDTLDYLAKDPIHRKFHHDRLTFRTMYAFSENFCLPLSHDEVVHGKGSLLTRMPGDDWQKLANLRLLFGYQWAQPGKKLVFMGGELGQLREWDHDSSLDWHLLEDPRHAGIGRWLADLNRLYRDRPALHRLDCEAAGFVWLDANDADHSVVAFVRRGRAGDDVVVFVFNFTPIPRYGYRVGVPAGGTWRELLNSDAADYGGSGVGNYGGVEAAPEPLHGQPWSVSLTLPPLAVVALAP